MEKIIVYLSEYTYLCGWNLNLDTCQSVEWLQEYNAKLLEGDSRSYLQLLVEKQWKSK